MRIVFWQDTLSFHQSAHIRSLAAMPGCEVLWVVRETLRPERRAMGWPAPDPGRAQVVVGPGAGSVRELARERPHESVHVFSGLHGCSTVESGLAACLPVAATIGILAERQDGRGWRGHARLLRARRGWSHLRARVGFVLAIGYGAEAWYARCGCRPERIYPYGYFMETPGVALPPVRAAGTAVAVVYVGALRRGKGVDVLLEALGQLQHHSWTLHIIGDGPEAPALRRLVAAKGVAQRVQFHGALPNGRAMEILAVSDLLVLPSRWKDGWGAVVSEAIMRGVPAICTDECGASVLLQDAWRGEVVRARSVAALCAALQRWIGRGRRTPVERQRIICWSHRITGDSAARYLLAVIRHALGQGPRPTAPWHP